MSQIETLYTGSSVMVEERITIGKDRIVRVPNNLKRLGVQYDHNIETVTFDCPRYWDGYDMSEMTVYISYQQANGEPGLYKADNVRPDKYYIDRMYFDWTIKKNVSMEPGKIQFQICIKKADEEGNEKYHWNSEVCKDCYISESLDCDAEEVMEQYPDIVEQWYRELNERVESGEFDGPPGVSPTIQINNIAGGHRVTITDAHGSKYFDVMDTYVDNSDAVAALLNEYAVVSTVEPEKGPAIWFDLKNELGPAGTIKVKDKDGRIHMVYPETIPGNVVGLSKWIELIESIKTYFTNGVANIQNGGTGASDAETARINLGAAEEGHEHEDLNALVSYFENDTATIEHGGTGASDAETARKNLGAAADNHTHEAMQTAIDTLEAYFHNGGAKRMHIQSCNDTDLNTLTDHGLYAGYTGMTNAAVQNISVIEVIPYTPDWILQRQTVIMPTWNDTGNSNNSSTYIRFKHSGTAWSPWKRMLTNILDPNDYGTALPAPGTPGRIFYKKVDS